MSNVYKSMPFADYDAILSQFIIDSWSYSKVTTFARNEKAFEMNYIYNTYNKQSATTIAGQAYHHALEQYFTALSEGLLLNFVDIEIFAHNYINDVSANMWKLSKTMTTIDECKAESYKTVSILLRNFYSEIDTYLNNIEIIYDVEKKIEELVTVNGVDIPLPCHCKIDLIIKDKNGKNILIDHKSKSIYTDEKDIMFVNGVQAITYVKAYEANKATTIDEVWFVENKISKNKDGSAQIRINKIEMTANNRRLYEALLYEPLRRMIEAVNNPDYVYIINDADNYVDKAELYEFWAKTMIAEIDEFNVNENKKELIEKRLKKIRDSSIGSITPKVITEFKKNAAQFIKYDLSNKNMTNEQKIEHILRTFGIIVEVAHCFEGYSSSTYLLNVSAGIKLNTVHNHKLDIASALDVPAIRISNNLVVYDNKAHLAIEAPHKRTKNLFFNKKDLVLQQIPIGKDNYDNTVIWDLNNQSTPHVLVCGATGSGKSVLIRSTIEYAKASGVKNIIIFDPKEEFNEITGVEIYNDIEVIENKMKELVDIMNDRIKKKETEKTLIIFDEFADAISASRKGAQLNIYENIITGYYQNGNPKIKREVTGTLKSLEENMKILLQKGRSSGFRIMAALQRASTKIITGDAKVNFPVQICFRVPKETDSRVVIDESGAESLQGKGDGLMKSPEYQDTIRFQGYYYSKN